MNKFSEKYIYRHTLEDGSMNYWRIKNESGLEQDKKKLISGTEIFQVYRNWPLSLSAKDVSF